MGLRIGFGLKVLRAEDRKGDEPRIQVAFVTLLDNSIQIRIHDTGQLASSFPGRRLARGNLEVLNNIVVAGYRVPTKDIPYLAILVRLIDNDGSTVFNRLYDTRWFRACIRKAAQNALFENRLPNKDELLAAASSAKLIDVRRRDDDDNLGVNVQVFKEAGKRIDEDSNWFEELDFRFTGQGSEYIFTGRLYTT